MICYIGSKSLTGPQYAGIKHVYLGLLTLIQSALLPLKKIQPWYKERSLVIQNEGKKTTHRSCSLAGLKIVPAGPIG